MHTLKQASQTLGISISAVKKRIYTGKLNAYKHKMTWLVELPNVKNYQNIHQRWLKDMETGKGYPRPFSPKTIDSRKWYMGDFWKYSGITPALEAIHQGTLTKAINALSESSRCRYSTKEGILKAYKAFVAWLITQGYAQESLLVGLSKLKPKRHIPPKRSKLRPDQIHTLFQTLEDYPSTRYHKARLRLLLEVILYSGLRISEALNLHVEDIATQNAEIHVLGKGNKRRITILPPALATHIQTWLQTHHQAGQTLLNGWTYSGARTALRRLRSQSNLNVTFHSLRRTCATHWVEQNTPLTMVAKLLGHSDIKTTQIYVEADALDAIRFVAKLKQII